jgi:Flp pilus assembly protein TadD
MATSVLDVAQYALPLFVLFIATVMAIVRRSVWGFLAGWFFATLGPSSSVLPLATEIAAERRMYLPLAALIVAGVVATYIAGRKILARMVRDPSKRRATGIIAAGIIVVAIVAVYVPNTLARNRDYWSDEGMWRDTVAKRPTNPRARVSYGVDLYAAGRLQDAERELREAVRLKETSAAAHANLGPVLCALGKCDQGIYHLQRALALDPEYTSAHGNLGEAYAASGNRRLAVQQFSLAVNAAPETPFLLNRLAWLLATSPEDSIRNGPRAVELARKAVTITRRQDAMSLETLSAAYAEVGRFDDALKVGREALALSERENNESMAADLARRMQLFERREKYRLQE